MKYKPEIYAKAFLDLCDGKDDRIYKKLIQALCKNGDFLRVQNVLAAVEKEVLRRQGAKEVVVEFARDQDSKTMHAFEKLFRGSDSVSFRINPHALAGVRIFVNGSHEYDASLAGRLRGLSGIEKHT